MTWRKLLCFLGLHVPVMMDADNPEYFCQYCMRDVTAKKWKRFWSKRKKYIAQTEIVARLQEKYGVNWRDHLPD